MVEEIWRSLPQRFGHVALDAFVVMPNHIHGILVLTEGLNAAATGADTRPAPTDLGGTGVNTRPAPTNLDSDWEPSRVPLGAVVGVFKSLTTHQYTKGVKNQNWLPFQKRLWQRNYYEHIIRTSTDLDRIRTYIYDNPKSWQIDQLHPGTPSDSP